MQDGQTQEVSGSTKSRQLLPWENRAQPLLGEGMCVRLKLGRSPGLGGTDLLAVPWRGRSKLTRTWQNRIPYYLISLTREKLNLIHLIKLAFNSLN